MCVCVRACTQKYTSIKITLTHTSILCIEVVSLLTTVLVTYQPVFQHEFKTVKRDILDGTSSKSRFGMALTHLGDINYDGYNGELSFVCTSYFR